jgi:uncharacterized membrane protein YhfC
MLEFLYPLNALLMIAMPIMLGVILAKRAKASWSLFGVGALAFIASQIVHLPLNFGLTRLFAAILPITTPQPWMIPFNAVVLGLTAGLCEETARYLALRWVVPRARSFRDALMLGAGHGGIEAILLGLLTGFAFIQMMTLRQTGLDSLGLTGQQLAQAQQQIAAYWSAPAYMVMLGAVERFFAIILHLSLSVIVMQVFLRRQWRWLVLAIGYHALSDAVAVFAVQSKWDALVIEGLVALLALGALAMIGWLRPRTGLIPTEPDPVLVPGASSVPLSSSRPEDMTRDQIDNSRFA